MSDFDTLLDFGDSGTTDTTKQSAQDPFAAPDSTANGGGGENLLDLGFDMQVCLCLFHKTNRSKDHASWLLILYS